MADGPVATLSASDALVGTELFYADGLASAAAADVKVTAAQIKTFCSASPTLVTPVLGAATATSVIASSTVKGILTTVASATTGLTAGVLAALTNASIVITDGSGQVYRVPVII